MARSGESRDGQARFFADVLSFGWVLPAAIAAGAGLGWLLDRWLGVFPVCTIVLGALGLAAGLRALLREAAALAKTDDSGEDGKDERH
jgi:F0F1-type ATP synthase assembly protein I